MTRDWLAWHAPYGEPGSSLSQRLAVVQLRIRDALDALPAGPIRVISMCAGQGHDLLGVLADHPRRADVRARLVELDPRNVAAARRTADAAGLDRVEIVAGDAALTGSYAELVPVDLVLACGIFGNISDADIRHTVDHLSMFCRTGSTVIWTRHRKAPDRTPAIREWFQANGFTEIGFDSGLDSSFGVGSCQLTGEPASYRPDKRLFTFDPAQ